MQPRRLGTLWSCATVWTILGAASVQGQVPTVEPVVLKDRDGHRVVLAEGQSAVVGQGGLGVLVDVSVARGYRATFCENASTGARCRRLVGWNDSPPAAQTPPFTAVGTIVTVEKALFGYADLHAHPATHLAWGARGGRGALWGNPGLTLGAGPGIGVDLAPCPNDNHTGTVDPIIQGARTGFVASRESDMPGHGPYGAPTFAQWPSARSQLHQQMHVTMLRRAFDGGLRLMVAAATDNQMVDIMWNPEFSLSQGRFALREDADYKSAVEQFDFIQRFVRANAGWMAIARTPEEARRAIADNKLAVVLGLEFDELSAEEILKLKSDYGVVLVTPVHLINNSFGGAAAYETFFNVANYLMNGSLFGIVADTSLGFRFPGVPANYTSVPVVGQFIKGPIGDRLAEYEAAKGGHRNRLGIRDEYGLRRLMKAGLLIDVAHMSSNSIDQTLALAQPSAGPRVPIVYSHGGLRGGPLWGAKSSQSERGLSLDQYRRLAESGGILGLGTGENTDDRPESPIDEWLHRYLDVESNGNGEIALGTDLNGMAEQISRAEPSIHLNYPTPAIMNADWTGRSRSLPQFQLGSKSFNIARDGIAHIGMLPDFLAAVRKRAEELDRVRRFDQIFHSAHDFIAVWEQAVRAAPNVDAALPPVVVDELRLTLETGTDELKCGNVQVIVLNAQGGSLSPPLMITEGQPPHSGLRKDLRLMPGTKLRDISRVQFYYMPVPCDPFDTGDSWNIKTLTVTYDVTQAGARYQGVLMHKRGAPARKLDRGSRWTVYTER